MFVFRFVGSFLLRIAQRRFVGSLFHEPAAQHAQGRAFLRPASRPHGGPILPQRGTAFAEDQRARRPLAQRNPMSESAVRRDRPCRESHSAGTTVRVPHEPAAQHAQSSRGRRTTSPSSPTRSPPRRPSRRPSRRSGRRRPAPAAPARRASPGTSRGSRPRGRPRGSAARPRPAPPSPAPPRSAAATPRPSPPSSTRSTPPRRRSETPITGIRLEEVLAVVLARQRSRAGPSYDRSGSGPPDARPPPLHEAPRSGCGAAVASAASRPSAARAPSRNSPYSPKVTGYSRSRSPAARRPSSPALAVEERPARHVDEALADLLRRPQAHRRPSSGVSRDVDRVADVREALVREHAEVAPHRERPPPTGVARGPAPPPARGPPLARRAVERHLARPAGSERSAQRARRPRSPAPAARRRSARSS